MTSAIGYARVSTDSQGADGLGMEAQRTMIARACDARAWGLERVYEDVASGSSTRRPALTEALDHVRQAAKSGVDVALVVAKQDRLTRSLLDFAGLIQAAREEGWRLVVLDPDFDLGTASGRMMAGVLAVFAEYEREQISERTKAALAAAKARGVRIGGTGGRPMSARVPQGTRGLIVTLRRGGRSWREVAAELEERGVPTAGGGRWHPGTCARVYDHEMGRRP